MKIQAMATNSYIEFLCVQIEWGNTTALKLRMCFVCRQQQLSVSLLTSGYLHDVRTRIILWRKGHILKTATCKGALLAASLTAALGHFRCKTLLWPNAWEINLLKSVKLKSSKWDQNGILKLTNSIKVAYIRIVFILAHGILKCNSPKQEKDD